MKKIAECVSWIDEEDLCMIINTDSKKCVSLDDSGRIIWRFLREEADATSVFKKICAMFPESDVLSIKQDVEDFFSLLSELKMLSDMDE